MTAANQSAGDELRFYCGCYTSKLGHVDGKGEAVGVYSLDTETGAMRRVGESPAIRDPSHLCLGADGTFLYSISETTDYGGANDGYLTVFAVAAENGGLTLVQSISSHGPGPAYVRLDQTGKFLLLANYVAGNAVVYPINDDGELGAPTANAMHEGSSVNPARQEAPHPHSIVASPDNRFVYVPDLGIDRIVAYRFDASTGELQPAPKLDVIAPPGSGPRHMVFAPSGKYAYLSLEMASEAAAYSYDQGKLTEIGRWSTLPDDFDDESTTAEVRVSPDGRNVYVANRGHDSLAVFSVDEAAGALERIQLVSTQGKTPRNFNLSPDGKWVVAGNQDSHTLVSYRRNPATGELSPSGHVVESPSPVLIEFQR